MRACFRPTIGWAAVLAAACLLPTGPASAQENHPWPEFDGSTFRVVYPLDQRGVGHEADIKGTMIEVPRAGFDGRTVGKATRYTGLASLETFLAQELDRWGVGIAGQEEKFDVLAPDNVRILHVGANSTATAGGGTMAYGVFRRHARSDSPPLLSGTIQQLWLPVSADDTVTLLLTGHEATVHAGAALRVIPGFRQASPPGLWHEGQNPPEHYLSESEGRTARGASSRQLVTKRPRHVRLIRAKGGG